MASRSLEWFESLPLDARREVDELCSRFEVEWRSGNSPSVGAYMSRAPAKLEAALLAELLALEIEYRSREGHEIAIEEYAAKFPHLRSVVEEVFESCRGNREQDGAGGEAMTREDRFDSQRETDVDRLHAQTSPTHGNEAKLPHVDGYDVIEKLGRGGMGVVYKARHLQLNRTVALKMILAGEFATERQLTRFLLEGEMLARIQHPNVVQVFEVGQDTERPYLALEYVEGGTLADILKHRTISVREAAQLVVLLARAIHRAHLVGVVHRDLKPTNILVKPREANSPDATAITAQECDAESSVRRRGGFAFVPKITDFGLARGMDLSMHVTESGMVMGTPSYLAPEQISGRAEDVGPLADVYALGAILYEALTSTRPFQGATPLETLTKVEFGEVTPPSYVRAGIPRDLQTICLKCLEKQPDRRYASADALAEDLERWLNHEPIRARPVGWGERAWKWSRRRPALTASLAAVAVSVLAIAIVASVAAVRLRRERDAVVAERDRARQAEEAQRSAHTGALLTAAPDAVPFIIDSLKDSADQALPLLRRRFTQSDQAPSQRLRAAVGLTMLGDPRLEYLLAAVPDAAQSASRNLSRALQHVPRTEARGRLYRAAEDADALVDRVRYAILALELGDARGVQSLLQPFGDPNPRTAFINLFRSWHGDLASLPALLRRLDDESCRSGLCAAVGGVDPKTLSHEVRQEIVATLQHLYVHAADGGTHSAAGWALRQWNAEVPAIEMSADPIHSRKWFVNRAGLTMLSVEPGAFSPQESTLVLLTRPIFVSNREVTIEQFQRFMDDPTYPAKEKSLDWKGPVEAANPNPDHPVSNLSREDAFLFCNWLSRREGRQPCYYRSQRAEQDWECDFDANGYRLPTEAEWDYAHRAGGSATFFFGDDPQLLPLYAHVSGLEAVSGGTKLPNRWGFFDMVGNVWEFCWDYFEPLPERALFDPTGPSSGSQWVSRGGAFDSGSYDCRADHRLAGSWRQGSMGFRVVCGPLAEPASRQTDRANTIEACTQALEDYPEHSAALLVARADALVRSDQWKRAAADLAHAIELEPDRQWDWFQCAPLLLYAGDRGGYRHHCSSILERFGGTHDPVLAERMAKACLLAAGAVDDLQPVLSLCEIATEAGGKNYYIRHFQTVRGMGEYRAGRYLAALEWLQQALNDNGAYMSRHVKALAGFFEAMAHHQLEQPIHAQAAFERALELVDDDLVELEQGTLPDSWLDLLVAAIAYREAQSRLAE